MAIDYLIHQPGKVASQTLEAVIRTLSPNVRVERHHYLSDRRLAYLANMCRLLGADAPGARSVAYQLEIGRKVRDEMTTLEPESVWVLSGFRDPLALVQSAFFQNIATYCPWVDRNPSDLFSEVDRLFEYFDFQFERMRSGAAPSTFQEALLHLKLEGPGSWYDTEFNDFYGIDIYRQEIGVAPFVTFQSGRFRFCVYRSETLPTALPALLQQVGLPPALLAAQANMNVTDRKEYSRLYGAFKERFRPTPDMVEYYYGGRFYEHFYGSYRPEPV